jgi:hypothetical protein
MVSGPGLDKLDLELPVGASWRPDFGRLWNNEHNEKLLKVVTGGMYQKSGDLRGIGLDARLSCGHRFYEKLGPKVEIFGMGKKTFSDVVGIVEEIIDGDACDSSMLRVDLTADTAGIGVTEFERSLYLRNMQTSQNEYGGYKPEQMERSYRRGKAETLYFNRGVGQVRIYNKTEHRKVLLIALNKQRRRHNEPTKTFFEEYGYDPSEIRTRVEKQCGGRLAEKLWGIRKLGEIHRLADVRPFHNFKFARDGAGDYELCDLHGVTRGFILLLRDRAETKGVADVRMFLKQTFDDPRRCREFVKRYEHLFMPQTQLTREALTAQYRHSIVAQLAA